MNSEKDRLLMLYSETSKHSNYQTLPTKLLELIETDRFNMNNRYEEERLAYILKNIDVRNKSILDIGGNTGYFSFELLEKGAHKVRYYEGNNTHAEFVKIAAKLLNRENQLEIMPSYYNFEQAESREKYDVILLLNVLHHIGDDYGDKSISIQNAKKTILAHLNTLSTKTDILVFQLGFNWQGNRFSCLFEDGTKSEMVKYIEDGTKDFWTIYDVGIAERFRGEIEYQKINSRNINRDDSLGEFLNRPIFIMKSLQR